MGVEDHTAIIGEFTDYVVGFVERPRPEMGNLPVCPFARKARIEKRMRIEVVELAREKIMDRLPAFNRDTRLDLLICVHPRKNEPSCADVYRLAADLNWSLPALNLLALAGHPDDPFNIDGLYTRREPYPNIQLLRQDVGDRAWRSIEHSGYYDRWTEDNYRNLIPGRDIGSDPLP